MYPRRTPEVLLVLAAALALFLPGGCAKKDSVTNPQTAGPTAAFTAASPRAGARPLEVDFTDQSVPGTSAISSGTWSFGDGTTGPWPSTGHLYGTAGTYTVSLTVTTAVGSDTETKAGYVTVTNAATPPTAAFSGTPTAGAAPLSVQFTDESVAGSAPITTWAWTFGDGGTSSSQSPSHSYATNGTYSVALTVTTSAGSNTDTRSSYIVVTSVPVPPVAEFSGSPTSGTVPLTVQFTDASTEGSAPITGRSWNFGDGSAVSTATSPSHTYTSVGTYTVGLTVTSTSGNDTDTKSNYITVSAVPVPPTAQFSGTPTSGPAPLAVQFTDQSTAGSAPITSRSWSFGDGSAVSTATSPSHTYTSGGTYTVSLTVTTSVGSNTQTKTGYIQVCVPPVADFTGAPQTGVAPLAVVFANLSTTGGGTTYSWNFGDGTAVSTAQNPSHTYTTPGTYTVRLIAQNACGADTTTKAGYITVADPCPNPVYTLVSALWDTKNDADKDGIPNRARLRWNADVTPTACARSVFAKIYYRVTGGTTWTLLGQSGCYTITGIRTTDFGSFTVSGLPLACYDFRVVLFECEGTTEKAVLEPPADPDLTNQCFEP